MSHTFKDKPSKILHESWNKDMIWTGSGYMHLPTTKTKKRKEVDTEWHWMSTPSWWTRTTFTRPERKATKALLHKALLQDIEEVDIPDRGRKPNIYYW